MKYKFENIHSDGDLNKYVLLLWKGVCNYEYMYSWKKRLMKIHYHLEKVSIVTQISKIFLIPTINIKKKLCKNISNYHDLYMQRNKRNKQTLWLTDIFRKLGDTFLNT